MKLGRGKVVIGAISFLVAVQVGICWPQTPTLRFVFESPTNETIFSRGDVKMLEDMRALNQRSFDEKLRHMRSTHLRESPESLARQIRQWERESEERERTDPSQMKMSRENANDYGNLHSYYGRYDLALSDYEKALAISRKIEDVWSEAITRSNMGTVYHARGQYDKAAELYEKGLEISRRFEDLKLESAVTCNLGTLYYQQGLYAKAAEAYQRSWETSKLVTVGKNLGMDVMGLGTVLGNQALLYRDWGQYSKALEFYSKALQFKIRIGDVSGQGSILADMAKVYQDWGQNVKAKEFYEKALGKKVAAKDNPGEGDVLVRLGEFYAATGQNDDAIKFLQQGIEIWKKLGIPILRPQGLIASIYLEQGYTEKAETVMKRSPDASIKARLNIAKSDYSSAVENFRKMLLFAEKNRNVDNLFTSYTGLGLAYEAVGETQEAEKYYNDAVRLTEDLRASLERSQRERFFELKVNGFYRTDPYKGLARVLQKMNRGPEAFKASEFTKARVFSEVITGRASTQDLGVPSDVVKLDQEISDQISALKMNQQRAYEKEDKALAASLEPQIASIEKKLSFHIAMLRERHPVFAATRYPQPMDLSQQALKGNEYVIAYDVSDSGVLVFLLKGKELVRSTFKPTKKDELAALVKAFRTPIEVQSGISLKEKLGTFDFEASKALFVLLLGDLVADLPRGVRVTIVPDDCLGSVPFEMLVLNHGGKVAFDGSKPVVTGADFFGDHNSLSYCQSVTALTLARAAGADKKIGDRILVIADPVFQLKDERAQSHDQKQIASVDKDYIENLMATIEESSKGSFRFSRLPETASLADNLCKLYGTNADKMTGLAATKESFLRTTPDQLGKYRSIVFATHGLFSKQIPGMTEPFLALTMVPPGTDGFLRMSDVMSLKLSSDLVALTACQSGLGKELSGEGVMSMGRAFQYAGSKAVLMSLWSVAEKQSVMLIESFFKNLKGGKDKVESLKLARDEVRKAGYDHPFFWASFILVGDAN